jgi:hypothetical protein
MSNDDELRPAEPIRPRPDDPDLTKTQLSESAKEKPK